MKFITKVILYSLLSLGLISCDHRDENWDKQGNESQVFTDQYEFKVGQCTTGLQKFTAHSLNALRFKLCVALLDEELNNYCASSLRHLEAQGYCD